MFLTKEELQDLTGGVQRQKMIQWLKDEGFQFRVGLDGLPVVLREHVRVMLGGATPLPKKSEPNLNWSNYGKATQQKKKPARTPG